MALKDMVRAVQNDLPITVRHEQWLAQHPNASYSPDAREFAAKVWANELGGNRVRKGFRASGSGDCQRKRIFDYFSEPQADLLDGRTSNIFHTGNFLHLKWQMAGLTEGWLSSAEVPLYNEELDFGGTADGYLYDGSLFEFKSINANGYSWVTRQGPKYDHLLQVSAYKLLDPSLSKASIVYENKNTGEWREYRVEFTGVPQVEEELADLHRWVQIKELPKMLKDCAEGTGMKFATCPYRKTCAGARWKW